MEKKFYFAEAQGFMGFTDIGGLGIQSGFPGCYSPGSSFSPTPERVT